MSNTTVTVEECTVDRYEKALAELEGRRNTSVTFLQSAFYARMQEKDGKTVVCFIISDEHIPIGCGVAVRYTAPGGLNFLYLPYGPVMRDWDNATYELLERFFQPIAKRLKCTFVRLDAPGIELLESVKPVSNELAKTASLQPRAEWLLDISPAEETVWMGFHKHARYNVRLAERAQAEVRVRTPDETPLDDFYSLMQTTGNRDNFGIFSRDYYRAYLSTLREEEGFSVLVRIDGKPAAVGLFVVHDGQAHYVFAGSSDEFRKIAPAYAVIWAGIQEAKKRGCSLFNFGGVTDEVKSQDLGGVTAFKMRFGGYKVVHGNPVDLIYKPLRYRLFRRYKTRH